MPFSAPFFGARSYSPRRALRWIFVAALAAAASPAAGDVTNPGFETYTSLPNCNNAPASFGAPLAQGWSATNDGTPDYYHLNSGNIGCWRFSPAPHTGCAHVGIMVGTTSNGLYREFVQEPVGSLTANVPVVVRYFVRRVLGASFIRLGVRLSPGPVGTAFGLPADADVQVGPTGDQYTLVELTVVPPSTGPYTLVLGSFETRAMDTTNYFFIDDVSISVCPGIVVSNPPVATVRCLGANASFTSAATGSGVTGYQWQRRVGSLWFDVRDIGRFSGATSSSLQITGVTLADYTFYRCHAVFACGAMFTPPVALFPAGPPLAEYRFDSSNWGADWSGNGFNGVVGAAQKATTDACGGFLRFKPDNGVDEFTVPDSPSLNLVGPMTGMAWIRPLGSHSPNDTGGCPEGTIVSKGGNYWFQVGQLNDQLEFQNEGSGNDIAVAPVDIPVSQWTHVAFVRQNDTKTIRFFVNGAFIGAHTLTNPPGGNTDPVMVGNHGFGNNPGACQFNGDIDDLILFGRALSDAEIGQAFGCLCNPGTTFPKVDHLPRIFPTDVLPAEDALVLGPASPSPMHDQTEFSLHLDHARHVRIDIFDVAGRRLRTIDSAPTTAGDHRVRWDGLDDTGRPVTSGIYLVRMNAGSASKWSRIVVVR